MRSSNSTSVLASATSRATREEPVRELHDVRLVHGRDLAAAVAARVVEGELDDAARAGDRDRLDGDARVRAHAPSCSPSHSISSLAPSVPSSNSMPREVLGVLADDDEIDALVARADTNVALARSHLPEEVERLSKRR